MLTAFVLSVMLVSGDDGLAPRVQTLAGHVERLAAIAVPPALEAEKQTKLADLQARLRQGAADEAAFKALYGPSQK